MIAAGNLFAAIPERQDGEDFLELMNRQTVRIERIVSLGHATPEGVWLEQDAAEWVLLVSGRARLRFEGEDVPRDLQPGDWLTIPSGARHRVEETDDTSPTIWLAVHVTAS